MEVGGAAKGRALKVLSIIVGLALLGAGGWYGWTLHEEVNQLQAELTRASQALDSQEAALRQAESEMAGAVAALDSRLGDVEREVGTSFSFGSLTDRVGQS